MHRQSKLSLNIAVFGSLLWFALGAVPNAGAGERSSRPFDVKASAMTYPLQPSSEPSPIRRTVLPKEQVVLEPREDQRRDRFVVKFAEGLRVRWRDGGLIELGGAAIDDVAELAASPSVQRLERLFTRSEADLDRDRSSAMDQAGVALADLNNYYLVYLASGADAASVAAAWLELDVVETAYFEGIATEACTDVPPETPDFVGIQRHLEPAPNGIDAFGAWAFDSSASGVPEFWFIDVERGWNVNHEDLAIAILNGPPVPTSIDHGTAVMGEVVGCDNDYGVTGIASGVSGRAINWDNESSIAAAFDLAASYLDPGEVYLIEIHTPGPGPIPGWVCSCNCNQFGYVPMEWEQANFDAIAMHTASGIVVVEAGGNGGMDLDHAFYNGLFDRNVRDSGAILVGAGTSSQHAPECWTNYGNRVDCQGFGGSVVTTGYGNLFDPGDANQEYTNSFSGTSSASPIVAGAAIVIQNLAQQLHGLTLDPITLRGILQLYGTPQGEPLSKHIGVLPDLGLILDTWFRLAIEHTPLPDTHNTVDDYEVLATVNPAILTQGVAQVLLHYRISGDLEQTVSMSPTGAPNEWHAFIPAQEAGNYVTYYLEAEPVTGKTSFFPVAGAADPLFFIVGEMSPFLVDELETMGGWTVGAPDDDATSGIWEHGDPHGTVIATLQIAPEDDHTPNGVMAFVTGNPGPGAAPQDGDVDDGKTTLYSPTFDLSGQLYARISFWAWTKFLNDDPFVVSISNDAGQTWQPLVTVTEDGADWEQVAATLRRETLPFTDEMQLRFVASDYGAPSLTECGVDDLVVEVLLQPTQGATQVPPAPPARVFLAPPSPNPFRPSTRLAYTLPESGFARLEIYDVGGRLVRVLVRGDVEAGSHVIDWDGHNDAGTRVAPGVYFIRLQTRRVTQTQSVVVVR